MANKSRHLTLKSAQNCLHCLHPLTSPLESNCLCQFCFEKLSVDLISEYRKLQESLQETKPLQPTFLDYIGRENLSPIILSIYLDEFHARRLCEDNYILTSGQYMQYLSNEFIENPAHVQEILTLLKFKRRNSNLKPKLAEIELNFILQREINSSFTEVIEAILFLLSHEIELKGTLTSIKKNLINMTWEATPKLDFVELKTLCSNYLRAAKNVSKAFSKLSKNQIDYLEVKVGRDIVNIFGLEPERTVLLEGLTFRGYCKAYLSNKVIEVDRHLGKFFALQEIAQDFKVEPLISPRNESEYYAHRVAQQFAQDFYAGRDFSWAIATSEFAEEFQELCELNQISLFQFCANLVLLLKAQPLTNGSVVNSVGGFLVKTDKKLLSRIISIPEEDWERQLKSVRLGGSGNSTRKVNPYTHGADVPTDREFMNSKMTFRRHNSWKRRNT